MELTGKIIAVLPQRSGVSSQTGNEWVCGSFVIETMEQYPKRMCFDVFGADRLKSFFLEVGCIVTVSFEIDAHEYNGKWFNSIRAWACKLEGQSVRQPVSPTPQPSSQGPASDLPFAPQTSY